MADLFANHLVKICGVTTLGDANAAINAGANAIGLILARSPRQLSLDRALAIAAATGGRTLRTVVFRDNKDAFILSALDVVDADVVQVHGDLSGELLSELRARNLKVVKALAIGSDEFFDFDEGSVDAVLVDGVRPGSGQCHSWDDLAQRRFSVPVIAAGGLTSENVAAVIAEIGAWGVDTASGVESSPGVKDRAAMHHFIENARRAFDVRGPS